MLHRNYLHKLAIFIRAAGGKSLPWISLLFFTGDCSKPPVNWDVASVPLALSGADLNPTVGLPSTYSILGGVEPFRTSLSGLGNVQVQKTRSILFQRPWQTGTSFLSVTDFLGKVSNLKLDLRPGAIQIGGGADPLTVPLQFSRDPLGNFYVLGSTQADMPATRFGTPGNQYLYLAKIDATGSILWISQLGAGPTSTTTAVQLLLDNSGNSYVLGTTDGILPGTQTGVHGLVDGFIGRFDSAGNLAWVNEFGGGVGSSVTAFQMVQASSGYLYVTGSVNGIFGGIQSGIHGDTDAFVARFSASGSLAWVNQLGGGVASISSVQQMTLDASENSIIGGMADGNLGGTQSGVHGSLDAYVAKFTSGGTLAWVNQWGGGPGSTTSTRALLQDSVGRTDIVGVTTGTGGTQLGGHGSQDAYLAQFSAAGALLWADQLGAGATANITCFSALLDASDNLYWTGRTDRDLTGFGAVQFGTPGLNDALLVSVASSGTLTWMNQIGGGNITTPSSGFLRRGGSLYVAGVVNGNLGGIQIGSSGNQDAFLLNFTTGGALNWLLQMGGGGISSTTVTQFSSDANGNLFHMGETTGDLGGSLFGSHGNRDVFFLKTNSTGARVWGAQLGAGGSSQTMASQFLQDPEGNTFVLGRAGRPLIGTLIGPSNFENSYLLKVDLAGQLQ